MFAHNQTILLLLYSEQCTICPSMSRLVIDGVFAVFRLHTWVTGRDRSCRHRGKRVHSGCWMHQCRFTSDSWHECAITPQHTKHRRKLQSARHDCVEKSHFNAKFNQHLMHHFAMIHSVMQWHECWEWLIVVFNMSIRLIHTHARTHTHTHTIPCFPLPPS